MAGDNTLVLGHRVFGIWCGHAPVLGGGEDIALANLPRWIFIGKTMLWLDLRGRR